MTLTKDEDFAEDVGDGGVAAEAGKAAGLLALGPELNPIEKLWDLIQDHTANKLWPSIERLDQVVAALLKDWWEEPAKILRLIGRGWIRSSANASNSTI